MKLNDASRIIDAIDQRVEKGTASAALVETTLGVVASVAADGKTASVYLYGQTDPSTNFRVTNDQRVIAGDSVRVAIDKGRGDRSIQEVLTVTAYRKLETDHQRGEVRMGSGSAITDTRMYRSGTKAVTLDDTAGGAATFNVVGTILQNGGPIVPTGVILPYGGTAAPSGYLLCDGSSVLRATYPDLFTAIGTAYGSADGTHFNLPNMQGKFPLGKATSGTGSVLGSSGGLIDHTHVEVAHTHTLNSHTHLGGAHSHSVPIDPLASGSMFMARTYGDGSGFTANSALGTIGGSTAGRTGILTSSAGAVASGTPSTANSGSTSPGSTGTANPPFVTVNYIIKT